MSSSSTTTTTSSDKIFLLRKDQQNDTDNYQIAEKLLPQSESTASNSSESHSTTVQQEAEAESCGIIRSESEEQKIKLKAEEKEEEEEEEDGFRTPTSLEHRIPEPKQCPAPPRKPKPSLKRKADHSEISSFTSSSSCIRRNPLDLSIEVELLMFRTQQHNPLSANSHHQNPKKSRTHQCK